MALSERNIEDQRPTYQQRQAKRLKKGIKTRKAQEADAKTLKDSAEKNTLYQTIGKTLGWGAALLLAPVNPLAAAAVYGLSSYGGGKIGDLLAGDIEGGESFAREAHELDEEMEWSNITGAIKSGLSAGLGAKAKLMGDAKKAADLHNVANMQKIKQHGQDIATNLDLINEGSINFSNAVKLDPTGSPIVDPEILKVIQEKAVDVTGDKVINMADIMYSMDNKDNLLQFKTARDMYKAPGLFEFEGKENITKALDLIKSIGKRGI